MFSGLPETCSGLYRRYEQKDEGLIDIVTPV